MNPIKGAAISFIGVGLQQLISLGGIILLARILSPEDFGIYALCFAIYLFFQSFLDFGLTPIYLKYPQVDKAINSSFLSINFFFGILVAISLLAIGPVMVYYYEIELLYTLFGIQAISAICMSSSNQPFSQLLRNKKFYQTELISVGANAIALITAILLAISGWGAISLAIKHLSYCAIRLSGALFLSRAKYQLVSKSHLLKIKPYIKQAYHLTISRLITGITGNIEKLFVGKIFGEITLGHYERGLFVVDKPNTFRNAITTPAMTYIASMTQVGLNQAYQLLSLLILNVIGVPCLFFFLFGEELTLLILGSQWMEAGTYVVWLSFLGLSLIFKGLTNIMYINALQAKTLSRLYWLATVVIFVPVILGFLIYDISMMQFVIIYSIISLMYWFMTWSYTLFNHIENSRIAFRVIAYVSSLCVLFIILSQLLQHWLSTESYFTIAFNLLFSWFGALLVTGIIFKPEIRLQFKFVQDRISNKS